MSVAHPAKLSPITEDHTKLPGIMDGIMTATHHDRATPASMFNTSTHTDANISRILMTEPTLIRQTGRILQPQIERRIAALNQCQNELDMKCAQVQERELARIQNLRNRFDQKSRELMADIDREFTQKKVVLRDKIHRETEKKQKLDYLLTLNDDESILRVWPDLERQEQAIDKLDPYNIVGMGHTLRVQTPPISVEVDGLRKSIESISIKNLNPLPAVISSTPRPTVSSKNTLYSKLSNSFSLPPSTFAGTTGLHRSLNMNLFPVGVHWSLDPRSVSHIHSELIQIANHGKILKVRHEARAGQRRMIRQNAHNLQKYWLNCTGDKAIKSGMIYFEVSCPRSDSWRIGMCTRDEIMTGRFIVNPRNIWAISYEKYPTSLVSFNSGLGHKVSLSNQRLSRIGVLADYERGEISFYNCGSGFASDERRHVYSVKTFFNGAAIYPLISIKHGRVGIVPFQEPPFSMSG